MTVRVPIIMAARDCAPYRHLALHNGPQCSVKIPVVFVGVSSICLLLLVATSLPHENELSSDRVQALAAFAPPTSCVGGRWVVYHCHRAQYCGGWADRLKGMVFSYIIAELSGRLLSLQMDWPVPITSLFWPKTHDWTVQPARDTHSQRWYYWIDNNVPKLGRLVSDPACVVHIQVNQAYVKQTLEHPKLGPRLKTLRLHHWSAWMLQFWHRMFSLHPALEASRAVLLSGLTHSRLVCVQARLGKDSSIDDIDDGRFSSDQTDTKHLWGWASRHMADRSSRLLMLTDSEELRQAAKRRWKGRVVDVPGPITHMDRSRLATVYSNKTVLDFLLVGRCDVLLYNSQSGFVSTALPMLRQQAQAAPYA